MTSRLYATTRRLFRQVFGKLKVLGLWTALTPLSFSLLASYICGLLLLERRQNATHLADWLPGRAHDAFNRLLTQHAISTRRLFGCIVQWAQHLGTGYLVVDDVVIAKPFSALCSWVGWTYSTSEKRKVRGLHVIVVMLCIRHWRIPVAFRLWRPKAHCGLEAYRTRPQLAYEMLVELVQSGLSVEFVTFDKMYTAGWLTKALTRMGLMWVGVLEAKTTICFRHRRWRASELACWLKLKWRQALNVHARSIVAYLPTYGTLRLVVTKNRHGNFEILVTNALDSDLSQIVRRKRQRWSVETLFRDAKQFCGLMACQCRLDVAMVRHVAFVLIAFLVLQMLRLRPTETLGEAKERLQRETFIPDYYRKPPMLKGKISMLLLLSA
ncbi:MAG TPA: transposase [Anaerolineales bacterium]|nr:transposase [Anaerolineales bacterium]